MAMRDYWEEHWLTITNYPKPIDTDTHFSVVQRLLMVINVIVLCMVISLLFMAVDDHFPSHGNRLLIIHGS